MCTSVCISVLGGAGNPPAFFLGEFCLSLCILTCLCIFCKYLYVLFVLLCIILCVFLYRGEQAAYLHSVWGSLVTGKTRQAKARIPSLSYKDINKGMTSSVSFNTTLALKNLIFISMTPPVTTIYIKQTGNFANMEEKLSSLSMKYLGPDQ